MSRIVTALPVGTSLRRVAPGPNRRHRALHLAILGALCSTLGLDQAGASGLLIPRGQAGSLEIVSHRVDASIDNQVARTRVTQVFRNPSARTLQAEYLFPLPEGAGVSEFAMWVEGQRREALVIPSGQANQIYDSIVRTKRDPAILEQVGDRSFRMRVFPILPESECKIELVYDEVVPVEGFAGRYVYPLKTSAASSAVTGDFTLSVRIRSALPIGEVVSSTHEIDVIREGGGVLVGTEATGAALDRDFELRYELRNERTSVQVAAARGDGDGTFLLLLSAGREDVEIVEKDVILLMDTSGSMKGPKIALAQDAMRYFVQSLRPGDRFNILTFSTGVRRAFDGLRANDAASRAEASAFIDRVVASGGTAIDAALQAALGDVRVPGATDQERPLRVIFVTDGEPTVGSLDPKVIVKNAIQANRANARVFAFGVESNIDSKLLNLLAAKSGGSAEQVAVGEELEITISDFVDKIGRPVVSDIRIAVEGVGAHDIHPQAAADLFFGSQVLVVGHYGKPGAALIRVTGTHRGERVEWTSEVRLPERTVSDGALPRLWAKRRIGFLQDEIWWNGDAPELKDEIVELSRAHKILTPYTAMLILEKDDDYRRFGLEPPTRSQRELQALAQAEDPSSGLWTNTAELEGRIADGSDAAAASDAHTGNAGFLGGLGSRVRAPSPSAGRSGPGLGGPNTGGPTRPGPGGASSPGGRGPSSPGGGGGGLAKKSPRAEGFEQWTFWWEYHKERFSERRRSVLPDAARSAIVDGLLNVLEEDDCDIVDAAVMALAKATPVDRKGEVRARIEKVLRNPAPSVEQSAILALGILGDRGAAKVLRDILIDAPAGRTAIGAASGCSDLSRSFAALSLGWLGDASGLTDLLRLAADPKTPLDVASCCVLALGSFENHKDEIVTFLMTQLKDETRDRRLRAQIPIALAQIGAGRSVDALIRLGKSRKLEIRLGESIVIAVGRLARFDDEDASAFLIDAIDDSLLEQTRHFAIQALADIVIRGIEAGASDDKAERSRWEKRYTSICDVLVDQVRAPKEAGHRPWASIALARVGRAFPESHPDRVAWTALLNREFEDTNNASHKGAMAISLGLLAATTAEQSLLKSLHDTQDLTLIGDLSVALGLLRSPGAKGRIGALALDAQEPRLALRATQALGYYQDGADVPRLRSALANAETLSRIGALAASLAGAANEQTIEDLLLGLADSRQPGLTRAFCAVALGLIGDQSDRPWNAELVEAMNYRIVCGALYEIADIW